jgi:hypothetical protein
MDPHLGGRLRIMISLRGNTAEAETVLYASVYDVLKNYMDGNASFAETVKAVGGGTSIQRVTLDGCASINETILVEGDIDLMLDLIAKLETAELTRHGASMIAVYISISAYATTGAAAGAYGAATVQNLDTDGLLVIGYKYTTEENSAGGTTYNISSEYYSEDGNTVHIGGKHGNQ